MIIVPTFRAHNIVLVNSPVYVPPRAKSIIIILHMPTVFAFKLYSSFRYYHFKPLRYGKKLLYLGSHSTQTINPSSSAVNRIGEISVSLLRQKSQVFRVSFSGPFPPWFIGLHPFFNKSICLFSCSKTSLTNSSFIFSWLVKRISTIRVNSSIFFLHIVVFFFFIIRHQILFHTNYQRNIFWAHPHLCQ